MSKIHVDDKRDLEIKFIILVELAKDHIEKQDIYKDQFGSVAKLGKHTSMERLRKYLGTIKIENSDPADEKEKIKEIIYYTPDDNETT